MAARWLLVVWMLLAEVVVAPALSASPSSAERFDVCAGALERYVIAPESRQFSPRSIARVDLNGGRVDRPEGLLVRGGDAARLERVPGGDPAVVIDFGRNVTGRVRVTTNASSSAEVRLAASESLRFLSRESDVTWGEQRTQGWQPPAGPGEHLTGQLTFRYLLLFLAADGWVEVDHVVVELSAVLGTPDTYAGCFLSSDDELNRLWYAGAYTLEMTTVETASGRRLILDGAKRDRHVWIGDVSIAGRVEYLTHNQPDAVRDTLAELADRQRADRTIPPSSFMDYGLILFDYYAWWVVTFSDYHLYTGDRAFAERYYPHMRQQLDWFHGHVGPNGLIVKDAGIEWAHTLGRNGEISYLNAVYVRALRGAADLAAALGNSDDAATWRARADAVAAAMHARLFDAGRGVYVDSDLDRVHVPQDGNALAVLYGIAPPEARAGILDYLRAHMWTPFGSTTVDVAYGHGLIHDKRIWPFIGFYEVEARFEAGDTAGALDLLRRQWGHMLRSDPASTFWEWMTAEGQIENGFASLAHSWSAGPTVSLTERVLGVRPAQPGYSQFVVLPQTSGLPWARGRVPTPHGPIDVAWSRSEDTYNASLIVPAGTQARAGVPQLGEMTRVFVDGRLVWDGARATAEGVGIEGGYVQMTLGPGHHEIDATTDSTDFPETGESLRGTFKDFWERSGGLMVFGYPLSPQLIEDARRVQYFERQRFEYHPRHAGTPYQVQLGLLGVDEARRRGHLESAAFQPRDGPPAEDCRWFPETGHAACGGFRVYWETHGLELGDDGLSFRESLALFGYPISGEYVDPETGLVTQYFERARFEYHPLNPEPFRVLLGRVGATLLGDDS